MSWTAHNHVSGAAMTLAGLLALPGTMIMQNAVAAQPRHPQGQSASQPPLPQHLDLRAPAQMPQVDAAAERNFPSRRTTMSSQDAVRLPELGTHGARTRPAVQEFVRRVRQEGLPVARLFEGKSALVHLGLNPKGKPGLWLVQKIR